MLELLHAAEEAPAVGLELRLTRTSRADATTLLAQRVTAAAQAREPVAELRELHLHHALLAACVLSEDVEDQRDTVDHVDVEQCFEVALLRGRELVVEDRHVDVVRLGVLGELLRFALADVGGRLRRGPPLQLAVHGLGTRGDGEPRQLVERLGGGFHAAPDCGADEQRTLADHTEVDLGRGEAPPTSRPAWARRARLGDGRCDRSSRRSSDPFAIDLDVEHVGHRAAEADHVAEIDHKIAARNMHRETFVDEVAFT